MIQLSEMLSVRGFVPKANQVKLGRHKDSRVDFESLRAAGWFDTYQNNQSKPVFDGCKQIVVFFGEDLYSRFIGVYDVGARRRASEVSLPPGCPYPEWKALPGHSYYPLKKRSGFEDLEDRLIINLGNAPLVWHQWFTDCPVVEIRPAGRALPPFRDYLRVHLSFDDLAV